MEVISISASATRLLLTAEQLAQRWQVTKEWVYRNRLELHIPTITIGGNVRFALDDIEAFENAHRN
jgi:predicted DNA-binding transcriptional regulator AlpA